METKLKKILNYKLLIYNNKWSETGNLRMIVIESSNGIDSNLRENPYRNGFIQCSLTLNVSIVVGYSISIVLNWKTFLTI